MSADWFRLPTVGLRVVLEPCLDWQGFAMRGDRGEGLIMVAGSERYPQVLFQFHVKPQLLVTDPGPLDAKVP